MNTIRRTSYCLKSALKPVAALVLCAGLFLAGCSEAEAPSGAARAAIQKTSDAKPKKIFAPLFKLKTITGKEISLGAMRGKAVIVNLWASWCGPCREETPALERLYRTFKGRGVEFVGVAVDENLKDVDRFIKEFNVTYPMGLDDTGIISRDYGANFIPMTIVVAPDGSVSYVYNGMIREEHLHGQIMKLISDRPEQAMLEK